VTGFPNNGFRAIEALAASDITSGRGGENGLPEQPGTPAALAKLLANALGPHRAE